jgi:hypothetical protein
MGLDRMIKRGCARLVSGIVLIGLLAACDHGGRPKQLLYGESAGEFRPVQGSVISRVRVLDASRLGNRFGLCTTESGHGAFPPQTVVVERIGVFSESLTFADARRTTLFACDGGVDPAGERKPPWCGGSAGVLHGGKLLDPRLDVLCRTNDGHRLAYAWVEPVAGAHWIGIDQGSYVEIYEAAAGFPVRVATRRNIHGSQAEFEVMHYGPGGRELVRERVEAAVAG